jgi:hypothetical protein
VRRVANGGILSSNAQSTTALGRRGQRVNRQGAGTKRSLRVRLTDVGEYCLVESVIDRIAM